ncbi:MAG: tetratricopeptide repeat protein [Bacteroidales bacterium]|nr:tetratricopeptide repeat protein [Bacteroidales bacterium]
MKTAIRTNIIFIFLFNIFFPLLAQQTARYQQPEADYKSGLELFEKEKFGSARELFTRVIETVNNPNSPLRINAEYYDAVCASELFHEDAENKLKNFALNHPANSRINEVRFHLGRLAYRDKKYHSAEKYFDQVDVSKLNKENQNEFYFKMAYCQFKNDNLAKAKAGFEKSASADSKYRGPANYYLAHIAYLEKDYDEALEKFTRLSDDENFKGIAPYYVVQILFLQGKYDEVLEQAPPLLVNATKKREPEIAKIIGESYYYSDEAKKGLPYLQQYQNSTKHSLSRQDHFKMGYCLYVDKDYEKAAKSLQQATGSNDTLAQYAQYFLAACYLQTGQKQFAANAFKSAYRLGFDREITEDALFNQAQLAFELSYDPYSEAVKALRDYLKTYPDSKRSDEAYNFLFKISMATRNFKDAQEALYKIQVKGPDYESNFQKITFYRGIELFNAFDYEGAVEMFTKSAESNADKMIAAESRFWIAEAFYRQENYWGAKKYYTDFLTNGHSKKLPVYNLANYNLGYVNFKRKDYSGAIYYLKEFLANLKSENPSTVADAFLRLGDSWFISKGYDNAIAYYDKAISMNSLDVDYAMYQKALALGVLQRYDEKIQTLNSLAAKFPASTFISEVYYELGNTYLVLNNSEKALLNFKKITEDYPNSSFAVKARLKTGLIYYNNNLNDLALKTFKDVVRDYPATTEANEALNSIRNIYVDMGQADAYFKYTSDLPFAGVSVSQKDSISYISAENQYMSGDCSTSAKSLQNYIDQFPEGAFLTRANFYLGECYLKENKLEEALACYENVLNRPLSDFTGSALEKAANISFELEKYDQALKYFTRLEEQSENKGSNITAVNGQMQCNYKLGNYTEAEAASANLLKMEKISDEMKLEAMQIRANSLYKTDEFLLAKSAFKEIVSSSQGEAGAIAGYHIAEIDFFLKDYNSSEKEIFELINQYAPYDYWVVKGFLLLADVYMKKENTFQAKQTLQSVIDNSDNLELKNMALDKLNKILDMEEGNQMQEDQTGGAPDTIRIEGEKIELDDFRN